MARAPDEQAVRHTQVRGRIRRIVQNRPDAGQGVRIPDTQRAPCPVTADASYDERVARAVVSQWPAISRQVASIANGSAVVTATASSTMSSSTSVKPT